jgi:hypothetical protein
MNEPKHIKHTMKKPLLFIGLDVHAKNITIALAESGGDQAHLYGTIPNDLHALKTGVMVQVLTENRGHGSSLDRSLA